MDPLVRNSVSVSPGRSFLRLASRVPDLQRAPQRQVKVEVFIYNGNLRLRTDVLEELVRTCSKKAILLNGLDE